MKCEYIDFDGEEEPHRVEEQYRLEVGLPLQMNNILSGSSVHLKQRDLKYLKPQSFTSSDVSDFVSEYPYYRVLPIGLAAPHWVASTQLVISEQSHLQIYIFYLSKIRLYLQWLRNGLRNLVPGYRV